MPARAGYRGVLFPAMGNHECSGLTSSNCGAGNTDGMTGAYRAYLTKLLAPIGQATPYYEVDVDAKDASWTSKIVFIAPNAWTSDQATWFDHAMDRVATYTFVVRHEGSNAVAAPGVTPSEEILAAHPYTLAICGHTHTRTTIRNGARSSWATGEPPSSAAPRGMASPSSASSRTARSPST